MIQRFRVRGSALLLGLLGGGGVWAQQADGSITFSATPMEAASVPTLSEWGLILLAVGVGLYAMRAIKRSGHGGTAASWLWACAIAVVLGGGLVGSHRAYSSIGLDAAYQVGLAQGFRADFDVPVINDGGQDLYVARIQAASGFSIVAPDTSPRCVLGTRIPANSNSPVCYVKVCATSGGCTPPF